MSITLEKVYEDNNAPYVIHYTGVFSNGCSVMLSRTESTWFSPAFFHHYIPDPRDIEIDVTEELKEMLLQAMLRELKNRL